MESKEKLEQESYIVEMYCTNCNHEWREDFPKGMSANGFFRCPYCGCQEGKSRGKPKRYILGGNSYRN